MMCPNCKYWEWKIWCWIRHERIIFGSYCPYGEGKDD